MNSPENPFHFSPSIHQGFGWAAHAAQLAAAAYLVGILATAIYMVLTAWRTLAEFAWIPLATLLFILPALVYQLGFFHYFPELLGRGDLGEGETAAPMRWSRWLRVSQWVFLPFVLLFGILVGGPSNALDKESLQVYAASALWVCASVLICAGLRKYLALTRRAFSEAVSPSGRHPFAWLAERLQPELAIPLGAVLVLLSLSLSSSLDGGGSGETGYRIVTGSAPWITSQHLPYQFAQWKQILFWVGRGLYVLGVSLAVVMLLFWLRGLGRRGYLRSLRNRLAGVTALSGLIALFLVSDLFFGFLALDDEIPRPIIYATCFFRMVYWIVPVALWSLRRRWAAVDDGWGRAQGIFIVLYVPLILANAVVLACLTMFGAYGYFGFMFGTLLLWWGLLQIVAEESDGAQSREKPSLVR